MYTIEDLDKFNRVTKVIVDTNAYYKVGFDFLGIRSSTIKLFMEALKSKSIGLLNHPILEQELMVHLDDSKVISKMIIAQNTIRKNRDFLSENIFKADYALDKFLKYDFREAIIECFKSFYKDAINLEYPKCDLIFSKYFLRQPPFSNKKKEEFPDAFVLQSLADYINKNLSEMVLVISDDNDWKSSLNYYHNIVLCKTIPEAINVINHSSFILSDTDINDIISKLSGDIFERFDEYILFYDCCVNGFEEWEDAIIDTSQDHEIVSSLPLKVTEDEIIARIDIKMKVTGSARELNYDMSCWDSEDRDYAIKHYDSVNFDGISVTPVEVHIKCDKDDLHNIEVDGLKIIDDNNIVVDEITDITVISN